MPAHNAIVPASVSADLITISIAVLVWGIGAVVVATVLADRRGLLPRERVSFGRWTAILAAALSLGAAAIHFAVIGEHFAEYPPYGVAFSAFAWFQVASAAAFVAAWGRAVAMAAIAVNGGGLVVWAVSRWIGLPFGPEPGQLEPVGPLDVAAAALEMVLIVVLLWVLAARSVRWQPALPFRGAATVLGTSVLSVVLLTSAAFVAAGGAAHSTTANLEQHVDGIASPPDRPESAAPSSGPTQHGSSAASPAVTVEPGSIRFGTTLDLAGAITASSAEFRPGDATVWIADLREPPRVPVIQLLIVQVLPDGREFEHWRQEIAVDPNGSRLVAGADLSIYVHGGEGSYRLRYLSGDALLAEGVFELVP